MVAARHLVAWRSIEKEKANINNHKYASKRIDCADKKCAGLYNAIVRP